MMDQMILLPDHIENIVLFRCKAGWSVRQKGLVLQIGTIQREQMAQAAQIQRALNAEDIGGVQFQLGCQKFDHCGGHPRVHLQPHCVAKAPLPHRFLDGFEQIVRFQFLNRHLGIAGEVEQVRPQNFEAGKQMVQIGDDQMLQPDETVRTRTTGRRAAGGSATGSS